jgi:outer membrane protein TolC
MRLGGTAGRIAVCSSVAAALTVLLGGGSAAAQDRDASAEQAAQRSARPMSLRQVLDVVVRQNPDLILADIDIAGADAGVLEAAGLDDWQISANGNVSVQQSELVPGRPFQLTKSDTIELSAELSRALPSGGTLGLLLGGNYGTDEFAVLDVTGQRFDIGSDSFSSSLSASLRHPLLSGRGERIARAPRRKARIARSAAELRKQLASLYAVSDAITAYWELAYAARAVEIQRGALGLASEQLRITEAAIASKVAARTDALAVRWAIAVREQSLLLAEIEVSERSLELRRLAGLELGPGEVDILVTDPLADDGRAIVLDTSLRVALERNPTLALARIEGELTAIDLELTEDQVRSRLDFFVSAGPTGNAIGADETLRQMATFQGFVASAGLSYNHTLKQRAARGARERAEQAAHRVRVNVAEVERQLAVSVVRAVDRMRSARKRIEVSELALQLAEQNVQAEEQLFQVGAVRSFEVLQRQDELAQARLSRERAVADYLIAMTGLEFLTGELLDRHHIEFQPR